MEGVRIYVYVFVREWDDDQIYALQWSFDSDGMNETNLKGWHSNAQVSIGSEYWNFKWKWVYLKMVH